jgi:hypothetical protein
MAIRFLKRTFFVSITDSKSNAVVVGAACVNRNTAADVLRKNYSETKLQLKKALATIDFCECKRDQYVICVKGGPIYYGQVHELDLRNPLNYYKSKGVVKVDGEE